MSTKTKILVFKMKEIILTLVFSLLAIILIILMVLIITEKNKKKSIAAQSTFVPGVYEASIVLSQNPMDIEIVVDLEQIKSVSVINLSESVATTNLMYPLIDSSIELLEEQIVKNNSIENISYKDENKYTSIMLLNAIKTALQKAAPTV